MGTPPLILNPDTRCSWVVNLMPKPLYFPGRTLVPTGRWVGPRAGLDGYGEEKISGFCHDSKPQTIQPTVPSLYWLSYPSSLFTHVKQCWNRTLPTSLTNSKHNTSFYLRQKIISAVYFEFKTHLLSHFSELKIRVHLNSRYYFSLFKRLGKHHFPRRTGFTKRVVNFTNSEDPFLKVGCVFNLK